MHPEVGSGAKKRGVCVWQASNFRVCVCPSEIPRVLREWLRGHLMDWYVKAEGEVAASPCFEEVLRSEEVSL